MFKTKRLGVFFWRHTMKKEDEISKIFNDSMAVKNAMQKGTHAALLKHKQLGYPICVWRDEKVTWIDPENINVLNNNIKK